MEGRVTDGGHATGDCHRGEVVAVCEGTVADGGHAAVDHHGFDGRQVLIPRSGTIIIHRTCTTDGQSAVIGENPGEVFAAGAGGNIGGKGRGGEHQCAEKGQNQWDSFFHNAGSFLVIVSKSNALYTFGHRRSRYETPLQTEKSAASGTLQTVNNPIKPKQREGRVCAGNPGRVSCTY